MFPEDLVVIREIVHSFASLIFAVEAGFLPQSDMIRRCQDWNELIHVPRETILRHEFLLYFFTHVQLLFLWIPRDHRSNSDWDADQVPGKSYWLHDKLQNINRKNGTYMSSFYFKFNISVLANIWQSIHFTILSPPKPI